MDNLHDKLNLDLGQSFTTARKSTLKLVNFQSLVANCCKLWKI